MLSSHKKRIISAAFLIGMFSSAYAETTALPYVDTLEDDNNYCHVHTWHKVSTNDGQWTGKLVLINQAGSFVNEQCEPITEFEIDPDKPFKFGMQFEEGADFNFAYSLSMIHMDSSAKKKPICHYFISAMGPGIPQIIPLWINNPLFCNVMKSKNKTDFFVG